MADHGPQRTLSRVTEIGRVATRHGFGYLLDRRRSTDGEPDADRGRRLREMFDELGPTFVKFGQLLSTRPDVVPPDIIAELRKLQDDVSPVPIDDVERVVGEDLGLTVEQAFLEFDETPIAAASIGQVHRATLPNEAQVVVKVQRPNAARQIESDLKLMASAARVARERVRQLDFIDTGELVEEFGRSIRLELDYQQEARNAETFRRNFAADERIAVPRVWWRYTTGRLLTLDRLEGRHVRDLDLERWDDEARRDLAYRLTDAWMTMIFRHAFFHGDPHPSNILQLDDGRLGLIDFGLAGRLTELDMARLTRLFVDAATENVEALPRRLSDLGVRYPREREEELRSRLEELYYRYYGSRLSDIDPIEAIREGLDPDLRDEPPAADPVRDPRQGDRDARLRRRGGLPRLQRLRGRPAVREAADRRALLAAPARAPSAARRCRTSPRSRSRCRVRCTTSSTSSATASSRSGSRTRGSTTSRTTWTYPSTASPSRSSSSAASSARR